MTKLQRLLVLCVTLSVSACGSKDGSMSDGTAITGTYEADGVVVRILENSRLIQIRHGDIEGFMPAMTMPFEFRADSIRAAIAVDDSVHFAIATDGVDSWITSIQVID